MKKVFCVLFWATVVGGAVWAQSIDQHLKKAVDDLAAGRSGTTTVVIEPVTVAGSHSVSALSRYIGAKVQTYANENKKFQPVPAARRTRSADGASGTIGGSFTQVEDAIEVTLWLNTGGLQVSTHFTTTMDELSGLGLTWLPANIESAEEIAEREEPFEPAAALSPENTAVEHPFMVSVLLNSDTRTYVDGDQLTISLSSDQDCYFKVYHVDVNDVMRLIYPNALDTNNVLKKDEVRTIPEKTRFVLGAPYGEEKILVVASVTAFDAVDGELAAEVRVTAPAVRSAVRSVTRGLTVEAVTETVTALAQYTIVPK